MGSAVASRDNRNDDFPLAARSVELAEEDVLPRAEGELSASYGDRRAGADDRAFDVRCRVVVNPVVEPAVMVGDHLPERAEQIDADVRIVVLVDRDRRGGV